MIKSIMWIRMISKWLGQMSRSGLIKSRTSKRGQLPQSKMQREKFQILNLRRTISMTEIWSKHGNKKVPSIMISN